MFNTAVNVTDKLPEKYQTIVWCSSFDRTEEEDIYIDTAPVSARGDLSVLSLRRKNNMSWKKTKINIPIVSPLGEGISAASTGGMCQHLFIKTHLKNTLKTTDNSFFIPEQDKYSGLEGYM